MVLFLTSSQPFGLEMRNIRAEHHTIHLITSLKKSFSQFPDIFSSLCLVEVLEENEVE